MVDISEIRAEVISHEIKHPKTEEKVGIRVTLLPTNDPAIKKIARKIQDRKSNLAQRGKAMPTEEMEAFSLELVLVATTDWEWYDADFHGEVPEFSRANLKRVCEELDWFQRDIDEALGDTKRFFIA